MNGTMEIDVKQTSPRQVKLHGEELKISIRCQENVDLSPENSASHQKQNYSHERHSSTECSEPPLGSNKYIKDVVQHDSKPPVKLCDFYKRSGNCRFGDKCFFSHDLMKFDEPRNTKQQSRFNSNRNERETPLVEPFAINGRKERAQSDNWRREADETNQYLNINSSNAKQCRFFRDKMGCKLGDDCPFTHYRSVGDAGEDTVNELANKTSKLFMREQCEENQQNCESKNGTTVHRQHNRDTDQSETLKKASKTLCRFFKKDGQCRKGEQCEFIHLAKGESKEKLNEVHKEEKHFDNVDSNTTSEVVDSKLQDSIKSESTRKPKICRFYMKTRGCRLNEKCPFVHKTPETRNQQMNNNTDVPLQKENSCEPSKGSNKKCQFYLSDSGCRAGKNCSYFHSDSQTADYTSDSQTGGFSITRTNIVVADELNKSKYADAGNTAHKSSSVLCTFFGTPKGCFKGVNCVYMHGVVCESKQAADKDYLLLQETEFKQLEKRFSAGKKFLLVQSEPSRVYLVTFEPTDPDWGIVVKEFVLQVDFPADYPKTLFSIALQNDEMYPEGFTGFMNEGIENWLELRQLERDENDLAFRDFLRWFDRTAENLVLDAGRKVKQLRNAQEAGITLIPHDQILPTPVVAEDADHSSPSDDDEPLLSDESLTMSPADSSKSVNEQEVINEQESTTETVNQMMSNDATPASDNKVKVSAKVKFGTEIKFSHLEVNENVASMILKNVMLIAQCGRCKGRSEFNLQHGKKSTLACKKCRVNHCATFHPEIVHQHSHVAGYLHLEGCKAFDLVLIDSLVIINCLNCSKDNNKKGIAYGKKGDYWCEHCHTKMEIQVQCTKFNQLSNTGEKIQVVKAAPAKKSVKYPGVKEGTPLPDNGSCKHYKKSYRWLRFPCCGKLYACDVCHEEGEENDHEMKFATRMICGYCSKEQPFAKEKPCISCNANVTKSRSSHWEGGRGCRNRTAMSRNDNKKTAGLGKTISRKKADD